MTAIALQPEQFIFAQDQELKTTSLKIAEAFGKKHSDVLRAIEKTIKQVSDIFHQRNFALMQIDVEIGNRAVRKSPAYELTKDGYVMVVMGFTGEKAMQVKEAYINAFNYMAAKLLNPPTPPERKTKKALPGCLTLEQQDVIKEMVRVRGESVPKAKQAQTVISTWSAIKTKFGCSYKEIPSEEFANVVSLVARMPLEGELLPKQESSELDYAHARKHLEQIRTIGNVAVDETLVNEFQDELEKLDRCLIRGWTEIDESLARLTTVMAMLKRWRNK